MYEAINILKAIVTLLESIMPIYNSGKIRFAITKINKAINLIEKDLAKIQEGSYIF